MGALHWTPAQRDTLRPARILTTVIYRKFLGALALGLPTAVLTHVLSFGGDHALGGSAHQLVLDLSLAAVCATIAALCAGAIFLAAGSRSGSMLAARLVEFVPSIWSIAGSTVLWFACMESIESPHGFSIAGLLLILACALCVSAVVRGLLLRCARALAQLAHQAMRTCFAPRAPGAVIIRFAPTPRATTLLIAAPNFSRPPPTRP